MVCLFILHELAKIFGKDNVGLYRDDGETLLKNTTGRIAESQTLNNNASAVTATMHHPYSNSLQLYTNTSVSQLLSNRAIFESAAPSYKNTLKRHVLLSSTCLNLYLVVSSLGEPQSVVFACLTYSWHPLKKSLFRFQHIRSNSGSDMSTIPTCTCLFIQTFSLPPNKKVIEPLPFKSP